MENFFKKPLILVGTGIIAIGLIGIFLISIPNSEPQIENNQKNTEKENLKKIDTDETDEKIMITGGTKHLIPLDELHWGCSGRDCIPSIDSPKFVSKENADWLKEDDVVLGLDYNGVVRAYPLGILNWHEIVNDEINGKPVIITYCPLCGSALAYERTIEGEAVEFGVSGKLYNSDLVMYDRKTETLWAQIEGKAIVGELTGMELKRVPIETVLWEDWVEKHPNTRILSTETGYNRDYTNYPYGNYEKNRELFFPVSGKDSRLHEKAVIHGLEINGKTKAYPEMGFEKGKKIMDTVGGKEIIVERDMVSGAIKFYQNNDGEKGEEIAGVRSFWFAWFAFHPQTELYEQ